MTTSPIATAALTLASLSLLASPCLAQSGVASDELREVPPHGQAEEAPEVVEETDGLDDGDDEGLGGLFGDDKDDEGLGGLFGDDEDDDEWPGASLFVSPAWVTPALKPWDGLLAPGSGVEGGIAFTQGAGLPRVGYVPSSWGGIKYSRHRFQFADHPGQANISGWSLFSGDATEPLFQGKPATLSFFSGGEAGIYRMAFPDGAPSGLTESEIGTLLPEDKWKLGGAFKVGAMLNLPGNTSLSYTAGIHGIQQDMRWGHWIGSRAILGLGQVGLAIPFVVSGKTDSLLHKALGAAMNLGWFWLNYTQKYNWPWDDPAPRWYVAQVLSFTVNLPQNQPISERSEGFE